MYVRRSALELVGAFDLAFSPGYGEEVDFSQRCVRSGLCHVLADDVLVFHRGGISFAGNGRRSAVQHEHERLIAERHPYFHDAVKMLEDDATGPLARALSAARRALIGLSVAIDARILTGPMTGTQLHVLELIAALSRAASLRITAIVPEDLSAYAALAFDRMPDVKLLTREQAADGELERCDIVHRPYQVNNDDDLAFLAGLGERLIVTHQDLIGYHNPSYFRDFSGWQGYRRITRSALAVADRVVFFSEHARTDALAEDLVEPGRASVVHIGVDHRFNKAVEEPVPPNGAAPVADGAQAILCIGTDFRHKNRTFALRVLEQLQRRHNWDGYLLLVGPRVALGSSIPDEAEILGSDRRLADRVLNLGPVSEAEKAWLFGHAALAFYPTVHEGFGLIPFEAADHGVACMWAEGTSLSELLPDDAAGIVPWDPELTAAQALELMRDEQARKRNVAAIREAGSRLSWDATASRLLELYDATCNESARPASTLERMHGLMQGLLTEDAMRLIGPGGALPADVARPLLALATHPQIGAPVFGAIRVGYRASYRLRRRRRANGGKRS
jgi:glycosyltransferase involved in cell wall biosynthesis